MDAEVRDRWSSIAHRNRRLCSPVDETRLLALVKELTLAKEPYTVDLGCGKAEVLRQVVELHGGSGTGVDRSARMLSEATDGGESISFVHGDAASWRPPRSPDLAICIGSTHVFGGTEETITALGALVRPGGTVLLGAGYWRASPSAAHLDAFGMAMDELGELTELVALAERAGLVPMAVQPSSDGEWDDYEWSLIRSVERWAITNPDDPDRSELLSRTRLMRDTFLEWRRDTFGFALVVAIKPEASTGQMPAPQ